MTHDRAAGSRSLELLEADRLALSERARMPSWLALTLGVLAGVWGGSPLFTGSDHTSVWFSLYVVGLVLVFGATRATGVRLRAVGARGWVAFGILVFVVLALYSVSLALNSLGLVGWVLLPALLAAVCTVAAVRVVDASRRSVLRRDR
ncbi:hypothetical protein [Corynebacterium comes]|uniref:Uncharacterized protein n=1 Tax=Corynebacterium comes TaxID=2675218 RepID=A0A6B8W8I8_9CORY|nr:hypothetical protein [Corynebacterium comes]QGU03338.1 hypothetical protein CETAM_00225 [Corynebacterium comes]